MYLLNIIIKDKNDQECYTDNKFLMNEYYNNEKIKDYE